VCPAEKEFPSSGSRRTPEYLSLGRIIRPHGVRGALLVEAFSEILPGLGPSHQIFLGSERKPATIRSLRPHRKHLLLLLEGCEDRDSAEHWREQTIFIRLEEAEPLPEGVYYRWQILGLDVVSDQDEPLGKVEQILETGANDVYLVRDESGNELLLPAIESVILQVDLERGRLLVHLLPGLRPSE
jgi:16S rRNA processing protein RimM